MVGFVCVRCYSCGSVQSLQQQSKQRQWTCKRCHTKQALQRILVCSSNSADIQRFVMQCNMQAAQTEMSEAQMVRQANHASNQNYDEESDSFAGPHKRPRLTPLAYGSSEFGQLAASSFSATPAPQPVDWRAGGEEVGGGLGAPAQHSSLWADYGPSFLGHPSASSSSALSAASRREFAFTSEPPKQAARRLGPHAAQLSAQQRQAPQKRRRAQSPQRAGSSSTRPTGHFARSSSISLQSLPRSFPAAAAAPSSLHSIPPSAAASSSSSRWGSHFNGEDDLSHSAAAAAVVASASAAAAANAPVVTHQTFLASQRGQSSWAAHTTASSAAASALSSARPAPLGPGVAAASTFASSAAASAHPQFPRVPAVPSSWSQSRSCAPPSVLPPSALPNFQPTALFSGQEEIINGEEIRRTGDRCFAWDDGDLVLRAYVVQESGEEESREDDDDDSRSAAEDTGVLVGELRIVSEGDVHPVQLWLSDVQVAPHMQRRGIGTQMMQLAINEGYLTHVPGVTTTTSTI